MCMALYMGYRELSCLCQGKGGGLTETMEVKAPKPLLATAAGHTHLYSDAHYQSHSTNALCTKAFLSVSSLSMTLTLLQDQLPNSQGPMPMGMWGILVQKHHPFQGSDRASHQAGPSEHRMLCVCAGPLRPHSETPNPSPSLTSLIFMAFSLARRTSGRSAVCV